MDNMQLSGNQALSSQQPSVPTIHQNLRETIRGELTTGVRINANAINKSSRNPWIPSIASRK